MLHHKWKITIVKHKSVYLNLALKQENIESINVFRPGVADTVSEWPSPSTVTDLWSLGSAPHRVNVLVVGWFPWQRHTRWRAALYRTTSSTGSSTSSCSSCSSTAGWWLVIDEKLPAYDWRLGQVNREVQSATYRTILRELRFTHVLNSFPLLVHQFIAYNR